MATYKALNNLDSNSISQVEDLLVAVINDSHPDLDLSPGSVLRDILVNLYSTLEARIRDSQATSFRSNSLLEIEKDPDLADDEQVDRVLSNFNVVRGQGNKASGIVRISISSDETTLVSKGTRFTFSGLEFTASTSVRAVKSALTVDEVSDPGDISLIAGIGGVYVFDVHVEAEETGSIYNIVEGVIASSVSPKVPRLISAKTVQTFLGGKDTETNSELISKLRDGIVGKILGGRSHTEAKLKSIFPYIEGVGLTGFGDPELTRDLISLDDDSEYHRGGTVDLHVKTANYPLMETLRFAADEVTNVTIPTSGSSTDDTGGFKFTIPREFAQGLYTVRAIRPDTETDTRTLTEICIAEYNREIDLPTGRVFKPAMVTGLDLGFSSYQKVTVTFIDVANTDPSNITDYYVDVMRMPFVDRLQDFVSNGEDRSVAADTVVKGVVPILLGCNMKVVMPTGSAPLDIDDIKIRITNAVNSTRFGQPISTSLISHIVHKEIPANAYLDLPVSLYGKIYYPDKPEFNLIGNDGLYYGDPGYDNGLPDVRLIRSADKLEAPYQPTRGVSPKTASFFLTPHTINITVVEV